MIYFSSQMTQLDQYGPYVQIDDFLSPGECSRLISLMPEKKLIGAMVSEAGVKNISIRSTRVCALEYSERNKWVFDKIEGAVHQINREVYHFDIHGLHEAVQLMQYDQDDFYDWHQDFGNLQFSRRKLSVSVQLTDPSHYEGGELEFFRNGIGSKSQGTMILFPSFMHHRVMPVTKGTRRALVAWTLGRPFR